MKLLIVNPSDRYEDSIEGMHDEIARIVEFLKSMYDEISQIDVIIENEGKIHPKLFRTMFGEGRREGGPDVSLRHYKEVPGEYHTGSIFQVRNGKGKPFLDRALISSLTEGDESILVMGWEVEEHVKPTVLDLISKLGKKKSRVVLMLNCIGYYSKETAGDIFDELRGKGVDVSWTSEEVHKAKKIGRYAPKEEESYHTDSSE
jgi:hypothetical protein